MVSSAIPAQVQVEAALSCRLGSLVDTYCGGSWRQLASRWTVPFQRLVEEAKRRGLETFVSTKPTSEGHWLLETETGWVVFYLERGVRMYHEEFSQLEPAFRHWLDQQLRSHLLPGEAEA